MAGADEGGAEVAESADGVAVAGGVDGEGAGGLADEGEHAGEVVVGVDDIADDGDAVGFAEEGDVAGGMAGEVVDGEAGEAVAFAQGAADGRAGSGPEGVADEFPGAVVADERCAPSAESTSSS